MKMNGEVRFSKFKISVRPQKRNWKKIKIIKQLRSKQTAEMLTNGWKVNKQQKNIQTADMVTNIRKLNKYLRSKQKADRYTIYS